MGNPAMLTGIPALMIVWALVIIVAHVMLAVGIFNDGRRQELNGSGTVLVTPIIWALLVVGSGVVGGGVYWVMHHSNLRKD